MESLKKIPTQVRFSLRVCASRNRGFDKSHLQIRGNALLPILGRYWRHFSNVSGRPRRGGSPGSHCRFPSTSWRPGERRWRWRWVAGAPILTLRYAVRWRAESLAGLPIDKRGIGKMQNSSVSTVRVSHRSWSWSRNVDFITRQNDHVIRARNSHVRLYAFDRANGVDSVSKIKCVCSSVY